MSKVAATQPGGNERISSLVAEKVPQAVGKESEFIKELIEEIEGWFRGKDRS